MEIKTHRVKILAGTALVLFLILISLVVYVLVNPSVPDEGVADVPYTAVDDGKCVIGWVNANSRITLSSLGFTPYQTVTQVLPPGYQIKSFDLDAGGQLTGEAISDIDIIIFTDESDLGNRANNFRITQPTLDVIRNAFNSGLGVVVTSGNGGRAGTADFAANLSLDVVNYLQNTILYQDTNLQAQQIQALTSSSFSFLNAWRVDTRGSKYSYTGNVTVSSPAVCAASVGYGSGQTCVLSYLPPAGNRGFLLVDSHKGFIFDQIQNAYRTNPAVLIDFPFPNCSPTSSSSSSSTTSSSVSTSSSSSSTTTTTSPTIEDYDIGLTLQATVSSQTATEGVIEYTATVMNNSTILAAEDVILQGTFPSFVTSGQVTNLSTYSMAEVNANLINWSIGTLSPGESVQVRYSLTVLAANFGTIPGLAAAFVDLNANGVPNDNEKAVEASAPAQLAPQQSTSTSTSTSSTTTTTTSTTTITSTSSSASTTSSTSTSSSSATVASTTTTSGALPDTALFDEQWFWLIVGLGFISLGLYVYLAQQPLLNRLDTVLFSPLWDRMQDVTRSPEDREFAKKLRNRRK
ncbi:MAG: DUF11 domain-containing protein [Candidatus Doudnabacteria bacterium]|nr:DUF11 domain-containing protein [Candidatus Doudnabacteria bacterium]